MHAWHSQMAWFCGQSSQQMGPWNDEVWGGVCLGWLGQGPRGLPHMPAKALPPPPGGCLQDRASARQPTSLYCLATHDPPAQLGLVLVPTDPRLALCVCSWRGW